MRNTEHSDGVSVSSQDILESNSTHLGHDVQVSPLLRQAVLGLSTQNSQLKQSRQQYHDALHRQTQEAKSKHIARLLGIATLTGAFGLPFLVGSLTFVTFIISIGCLAITVELYYYVFSQNSKHQTIVEFTNQLQLDEQQYRNENHRVHSLIVNHINQSQRRLKDQITTIQTSNEYLSAKTNHV